jgi:hypothetical protein
MADCRRGSVRRLAVAPVVAVEEEVAAALLPLPEVDEVLVAPEAALLRLPRVEEVQVEAEVVALNTSPF